MYIAVVFCGKDFAFRGNRGVRRRFSGSFLGRSGIYCNDNVRAYGSDIVYLDINALGFGFGLLIVEKYLVAVVVFNESVGFFVLFGFFGLVRVVIILVADDL